ncbi:MAG: hypothetical protein ACE5D1_05495 [Fidelibacterota bacterium]
MKRKLVTVLVGLLVSNGLFAGGMVHNSNQSAEYMRTLNRNASTDLDAAFFNPAGLTKLPDGFHLYLSNQTIWQTRTVDTEFPNYNNQQFTGSTFAPAFPNIYLIKKSGKLAFSGGFMPIGGGGSAEFPNGLPSFDYQLARLVGLPAAAVDPALSLYGTITGYGVTTSFVGSSIYFSGQGSVSYALNPMVSLSVGIRHIYALNTYTGSLTDAVLSATGGNIVGVIPDINVDSKRTGSGITPLFNVYLSPSDMIGLSIRYEPLTKLKMVADTKEDGTIVLGAPGMFPDGAEYNEDLPPQLSFGLNLKPTSRIMVATSFDYWQNDKVNWDGREANVSNNWEGGASIDFGLSDALTVSAGYLKAATGANDFYQTDLSYSLDTDTFAGGFKYALNPSTALSFGISNTWYHEGHNEDVGTIYEERYNKTAFVIAFGLSKSL